MRRINILLVTILSLLSFAMTAFVMPSQAQALSGSDFQAGRIMDDGVFFNPNTMSAQDIQNFLNAKVPVCDTNGSQPRGGTTRGAYGASVGNPPPYTCLKDYAQNTTNKSAESGLCNGHSAGYKSSAQIIYEVAQSCGVNPKVLLVLLQKEQSLVTDDWPWSIQYRSATGYGCPDTAPCDAEYYGFFNQVYAAARQYKRYARDAHLFNYRSARNNYIQYNPNSGCGGSTVYVQNQTTAGLYNYTPYQPNQAALNNLYGTGDGCSAYGNRNFWRLYNDWFGSTVGYDYAWSLDDISISTGSSVVPGNQQTEITITARNRGNQAWSKTNYPVRLGTWDPIDHNSALYDPSWVSPHRPAEMTESLVLPGEVGHFTFTIKAPNRDGVYDERFNLVAEGGSWFHGNGYELHLLIDRTSYGWQMVSQSSSTGSFEMLPGSTARFTLVAKNTGDVTWSNSTNPVKLGTWVPTNRISPFQNGWANPVRPATLQESSVAPGQNGTFAFDVRAPDQEGFYVERFNLGMEGVAWLDDPWMEFNVLVKRNLTWQMVSQTSSTGSFQLQPGATAQFTLVAKNTGNVAWSNTTNPVKLGTWIPTNRRSVFENGWANPVRPATLQESSVAPGQNGTFVFNVKAPSQEGFYVERFNLGMEGIAWLTDPWMEFNVVVKN